DDAVDVEILLLEPQAEDADLREVDRARQVDVVLDRDLRVRGDERRRHRRPHAVAEHAELPRVRALEDLLRHARQDLRHAVLHGEVVVLRPEDAPVEQIEIESLPRHVLDEAATRKQVEDVWSADPEVRDEQDRGPVAPRRGVPVEARLVRLVDLLTRRLADPGLDRSGHQRLQVPEPANVLVELLLPLPDRLRTHAALLVYGNGTARYIWNIEPSFIASPMSPFTFSLPDMKSIWPDCLPESMSSQSGAAIWSVRLGLGADPAFTAQVPSLMTACQVPPPSPLTSYWITALVPDALSARNRPDIPSKVSFTVGMVAPLGGTLECRQKVKRSIPPVTVSTAPVMYRARSEQRKRTALATSSGSPSRCIATRLTIRS